MKSNASKTIHISNVANIAYGYCKILSQNNYPVELYSNNITHIMSQPAWDDYDLDPDLVHNEFDFYDNRIELKDYPHPPWYHSQQLLTYDHPFITKLSRIFPRSMVKKFKPMYIELWTKIYYHIHNKFNISKTNDPQLWEDRIDKLIKISKQLGPTQALEKKDLLLYFNQARWLENKYSPNDTLFGYMHAPISLMLLEKVPCVSVEIGTLREVYEQEDILSKLLKLAYHTTSHLIITNPDGKQFADRLNLPNGYSFAPHPVDEDIYKPLENDQESITELRNELNIPNHYEYYIIAPARQNWTLKGNYKYLEAFSVLVKAGINALLIIPSWGQDVEQSKRYCHSLGLTNILWIKPISEKRMIKYYHCVDVVLDQFQLGVFGLITSKAMSCGKPVITSYNNIYHDWCFKKHPPLIACESAAEIYQALIHLFKNLNSITKIGLESREWIIKNYSKEVTVKIMKRIINIANFNFKERAI